MASTIQTDPSKMTDEQKATLQKNIDRQYGDKDFRDAGETDVGNAQLYWDPSLSDKGGPVKKPSAPTAPAQPTQPAQPTSAATPQEPPKPVAGVTRTQYGSKVRVVDQKTGAVSWEDASGNAIAAPVSEGMRGQWLAGAQSLTREDAFANAQQVQENAERSKRLQTINDVNQLNAQARARKERGKAAYNQAVASSMHTAMGDMSANVSALQEQIKANGGDISKVPGNGMNGTVYKGKDGKYYVRGIVDGEALRYAFGKAAEAGSKDLMKKVVVSQEVDVNGNPSGKPTFSVLGVKNGVVSENGTGTYFKQFDDHQFVNIVRKSLTDLGESEEGVDKYMMEKFKDVYSPYRETKFIEQDLATQRKETENKLLNQKGELANREMGVKETEAGAKQTEAEAKKTLSEAQAKAYADGVLALGGGARLTRAQLADDKQMNDLAFKAYKLAWDGAKTDADREALRDSAAWMNNWIAQKRGEASQAQGGQPEPTADNIMDDQYKTKGGRVNPGANGGATTPPPAQTSAPTQTAQPTQAAPAPEAQTQPTVTETPAAPVKSNAVVTPEIMQAAGSAFGGDINSAFGEISSQQKRAEEAKAASEAKKAEEEKSRKDAASKQRAEYAQNLRERLSKKGWAPRLVDDEVSRALLKFDRMSDDEKKKAYGFESDELKKRQMRAATDAEAEKRRKADQDARDAESRKMSSQLQKLDGKQGVSYRDMTDAEKKAVEDERKYVEQLKKKGLSNAEAQRKLKEYRAARDAESRKMSGRLEHLNGKKGISGK